MNTIQKLQEKETRLSDRVQRLNASIIARKKILTESNIETLAAEINKLEIQLELTKKVKENTQEQLKEQEKLLNSKQYKKKLETYQRLEKQAQEETVKFYENLVALQRQAGTAIKKVEQLTKAFMEVETDKVALAYSQPKLKQPFSWLYRTNSKLIAVLKRAEYLKDKLEV